MPQHLIFLDFETFYDAADYTLKKMTPAEYILDPRYETIMVAVKVDGGPHEIVDGPDFPKWLSQFDPAETTTVTFNALFDNSILSYRYGFVPKLMLDAMAMARTLEGHKLVRFSLAALAEHIGQPPKGTAIHNVNGMRRADIIAAGLWPSFSDYAIHDNELCEAIFKHYLPQLPISERRLMDMVLRCAVDPEFEVDTVMLDQHIVDVQAAKSQLIIDAGNIPKADIMSSAKFKAALEALGVDIEYKPSPSDPDKELPAFSKTDEFMERLQSDPDPKVAALAAARIGLKSTLEETRSQTLVKIGNLNWPNGKAMMPIPLRYGGAHTHRLSGDWKMNMQNMPTVRGSKGKSKLRLSLKAPAGYKVVTIDLGQIEARLVAWLCRDDTLLQEFAQKLDPYNQLAGATFGRPVNRKLVGTIDEIMGFIGKTGILGLGYGAGAPKFHTMVVRTARSSGMDISAIYDESVGNKAHSAYRKRYFKIPMGWNKLNQIIDTAWMGHGGPVMWGGDQGGVVEIGKGYCLLPSGLKLEYDDPQMRNVERDGVWRREFTYRYGKMRHRLYGAKFLENIGQALARIIVMNAALRIRYRTGFGFKHQAHDELVYLLPVARLAELKAIIHQEMTTPPSWGLTIPLTADVGEGDSYGEAK